MLDDHILFIDSEAILIDKPAGLPVDAPRDGSISIESARQSLRFGFQRSPTAVHRLDRDTSGCLLLARNPKAHRRFATSFEAGLAEKIYLAVIDGVPRASEGEIDIALGKRSTQAEGWRMVADRKGKTAITTWRVLCEVDGRALIEFRPKTGRTHQLRVHAAEGLGYPILGDPVYGSRSAHTESGLLLHAWRLRLPRDPKPAIAGEAPLPDRFAPWQEMVHRETVPVIE